MGKEVEPRSPRWSRDLLNLRKIQETQAKQKKYSEAGVTKASADQLEAKEYGFWQQRRDAKIAGLEDQYLHKQQLEMGGLLKGLRLAVKSRSRHGRASWNGCCSVTTMSRRSSSLNKKSSSSV